MTETKDVQYWLLAGELPSGPFTAAQVHSELAAGRATWETLACPVDGSGWQPIVRIPGFGPNSEAFEPLVVRPKATLVHPKEAPSPVTLPSSMKPTSTAMDQTDENVGIAIGIGLLVAAMAIFAGVGYGLYEWVRPSTPKEVCTRLMEAETAADAKSYATERMHPFIDSIYADKTEGNPNDTFELTEETDGPKSGIKLVGFRGSFYVPDAGRSVKMEGHFRLVLSSGWKVDDWVLRYVDGAVLPKPVSMVDDYHVNGGQPDGPALPPGVQTPGPAKPLTEPPFQAEGVIGIITWCWNHYGITGVIVLVILAVIGMAIASTRKK